MDRRSIRHTVNYDMMDIAVVGLGLMGGSFAKALNRLKPQRLWGVDTDPAVLMRAVSDSVIDGGTVDAAEALFQSRLVVLCLPPAETVPFIRAHMPHFMPGSVVTDICGLKQWVIDETADIWRPDVDFVPGHPMTGREGWGYDRSTEGLFKGCNYILTPLATTSRYAVELVADMARSIGAARVVLCDPADHDRRMAATSHLPHIIAAAYLNSQWDEGLEPFTGGSYRDMTRIARMNTPMWAEIFSRNASHILSRIEAFEKEIAALKQSIRSADRQAIQDCLDAMTARAQEEDNG